MSTSAVAPTRVAERRIGTADRWISRAAAATVVSLAGIAGALSYSHMRQLAQDHGQVGWRAHAFPISVDGIEIVASLVLLADRRAGRRSGWLPWTALAVGTLGSLAANVVTAHADPVSRVIAGWPALALLVAVKLLAGILERRDNDRADFVSQSASFTGISDTSQAGPLSRTPARKGTGSTGSNAKPRSDRSSTSSSPPGPARPTTDPLAPGIVALLPEARAASDELRRDGRALTRDALASCLRLRGHSIRNASLTLLLSQLRQEQLSETTAT